MRNTPSLTNATRQDSFFWDGRRSALEQQVLDPLLNPAEHGLKSSAQLVQIVSASSAYSSFARTNALTADNIALALATYVRSLGNSKSRFDRFRLDGDRDALTLEERRGYELFLGPAQCATCHAIGDGIAAFTDNKFHSLGVGQATLANDLGTSTRRVLQSDDETLAALITSEPKIAALGRFNVTKKAADIGKYRTPSLRDVGLTAPYMHDGSIATLEEAVDTEIYYRSAQQGRPLILTPLQRQSIVAFLRSLDTAPPQAPGKP